MDSNNCVCKIIHRLQQKGLHNADSITGITEMVGIGAMSQTKCSSVYLRGGMGTVGAGRDGTGAFVGCRI